MADMTDRSQILLVAAVLLAVTFVSLALVVNSAIFTGNLATRGETTGASDALTYRHEVADSAEGLVLEVNEQNTSDLVDNVDASLGNVSAQGGLQNARRARVVTVDLDSSSPIVEARVQGNQTDDPYTNASGERDWTLATDADRVVRGEFNVTSLGTDNESHAYHLYINGSSGSYWEMAVFDSAADASDRNITVRDDGGSLSECSFDPSPGTNFTINLTAGEVTDSDGSTHCPGALDSSERTYEGFSERNVAYGEANNVTGNYTVTLERDGEAPVVDENNFDGTSPTVTVRIDVLDIEYTYESQSLHYSTTITIRPGEA